MRIKKGDKLEEIVLPRHDGTPFKLSETEGKKGFAHLLSDRWLFFL